MDTQLTSQESVQTDVNEKPKSRQSERCKPGGPGQRPLLFSISQSAGCVSGVGQMFLLSASSCAALLIPFLVGSVLARSQIKGRTVCL